MSIKVEILADSQCRRTGNRITTFLMTYPRMIHAEIMTHRVFSRNASSTRAIPTAKLADNMLADIVYPLRYGLNQPGMQPHEQNLGEEHAEQAQKIWEEAANYAAEAAKKLTELGLHKQWAGRLLEPYSHITVVLTATDFENFFKLRCHPAAQDEIRVLAEAMRNALTASTPKQLSAGDWHSPFSDDVKIATARAARTSYLNHDGSETTKESDHKLHDDLLQYEHMSPFEHSAMCQGSNDYYANFRGFRSYRHILER